MVGVIRNSSKRPKARDQTRITGGVTAHPGGVNTVQFFMQ